jgi:methylenetetrahydrofolate dehydrogenase (NADP+)/methenyltetrahydrofolate cyclohydrolase
MAEILRGAPVAAALDAKTREDIALLKQSGVEPALAILRVGARQDDIAYERGAMKRCAASGVAVKSIILPESADQDTLLSAVRDLNSDSAVHGVLICSPLPKHLDAGAVSAVLAPEKDVDGITEGSLAGVFKGGGRGFAPCTAQACMEILGYYGIACRGKRAAVIGRSLVVGRPAAILLMARDATVTVCHTRTENVPEITRAADIVVVAAGKAEVITGGYFSPGQTVLDVGINWDSDKNRLVGDVKFDEAEKIVSAITPVPGGVGTVTTSVLVSHVAEAARKCINEGKKT